MARRPFRFGLNVFGASDAGAWAEDVRRAEDLGYSVISMPDHWGYPLSTIPALTAAAMATKSIRIGTLVLNNDLRHPVVLAQDLASLDVLSGGRLEIGLGAGWLRAEYDDAGLIYNHAAVRVNRLAEAVTVMKGLFADETCTFNGRDYHVNGLQGLPKPIQRPHPPLLISGGRRQVLSLAAREANIVAINVDLARGDVASAQEAEALTGDPATQAVVQRLAWVREAAGERFAELELQMVLVSVVVSDQQRTTRQAAERAQVADGALSPHHVYGSVSQIVETLQERRERFGISYFSVREPNREVFAPIVAQLAGT
jgi:probable F420-dependent oxidoreductase